MREVAVLEKFNKFSGGFGAVPGVVFAVAE